MYLERRQRRAGCASRSSPRLASSSKRGAQRALPTAPRFAEGHPSIARGANSEQRPPMRSHHQRRARGTSRAREAPSQASTRSTASEAPVVISGADRRRAPDRLLRVCARKTAPPFFACVARHVYHLANLLVLEESRTRSARGYSQTSSPSRRGRNLCFYPQAERPSRVSAASSSLRVEMPAETGSAIRAMGMVVDGSIARRESVTACIEGARELSSSKTKKLGRRATPPAGNNRRHPLHRPLTGQDVGKDNAAGDPVQKEHRLEPDVENWRSEAD